MFRRYQSQPVDRVITLINPTLRGWVNYFAVGHAGECFRYIKNWVEKKVRRHMLRARKRKGFGWKRWSSQWLYEDLKLFNSYRVRRPPTFCAFKYADIRCNSILLEAAPLGRPPAALGHALASQQVRALQPRPWF